MIKDYKMFLAHESSTPINSFQILEQYNKEKILANVNGNFKVISNICPHQHSLISTKNGSGNRVCPYHNWSFTLSGIPITSGRTAYYCENKESLKQSAVFNWNGLLFDQEVFFDINVNFKNMTLMESRIDLVKANYKNIMNLFLDVDHIQSIHSEVYDLVDITNTDVLWKYYKNGSIQTVEQGAFWIALYPYTMIEWQKNSLFVTVSRPIDNKNTSVCVFKYADKNYLKDWKLNEFVWETAWRQDKEQAEIIVNFSDKNLEPQKEHFSEFVKNYGIN